MKNKTTLNETVREAMGIALLQLMETKPIQVITISEIATVAGVSRSSFYRNFDSKEGMLHDYIAMLYRAAFANGQEAFVTPHSGDMRAFLLPRFRFVRENGNIYRILYQQNLLEHFFQQDEAGLVRLLYGPDCQLSPFHRAMISGACAGVVRCWVQNNFQESEEVVADLFIESFHHAFFKADR